MHGKDTKGLLEAELCLCGVSCRRIMAMALNGVVGQGEVGAMHTSTLCRHCSAGMWRRELPVETEWPAWVMDGDAHA